MIYNLIEISGMSDYSDCSFEEDWSCQKISLVV